MSWINGNPLGLLALNSSNKYLLATSVSTALLPATVIATLRLLAPDPLFYLLGFLYGERALRWARNVFPGSDPLFDQIQQADGGFGHILDALVVVAPNNPVCLIAGVAKMDWRRFAVLNLVGTIGRILLMRLIGAIFEDQIQHILDVVADYQKWSTIASVLGVVGYLVWQVVGRRGLIGGVEELEEELGDPE
jgi:membrane protein DedA with SNARE-associated domain